MLWDRGNRGMNLRTSQNNKAAKLTYHECQLLRPRPHTTVIAGSNAKHVTLSTVETSIHHLNHKQREGKEHHQNHNKQVSGLKTKRKKIKNAKGHGQERSHNLSHIAAHFILGYSTITFLFQVVCGILCGYSIFRASLKACQQQGNQNNSKHLALVTQLLTSNSMLPNTERRRTDWEGPVQDVRSLGAEWSICSHQRSAQFKSSLSPISSRKYSPNRGVS